MKVKNFYNKNQFIIENGAQTVFQSYNSIIANITDGQLTLFSAWDFSHTTLKHLYLFFNDYFCDLNSNFKNLLAGLSTSKNKKAFIQNLIDSKKIGCLEG